MLGYFRNETTRMDIDTAALDQPGDEGWAYGRGKRELATMNRGTRCGDEIADHRQIRQPEAGQNDRFSSIDCPSCRFPPRIRAGSPCSPSPRSPHRPRRTPPTRARQRVPMTAPGTWSSPPRGQLQLRLQRSLPGRGQAVSRRRAAAGSRARSTAPAALRSTSRSAPPRRAAAAGSPATSGAGSLERHHLRRPVQRHLAGDAKLSNHSKRSAHRNKRPARSSDGPFSFRRINAIANQRGASTITTWRPSNRASCSTLANSATSAFTLSSSLVPIS